MLNFTSGSETWRVQCNNQTIYYITKCMYKLTWVSSLKDDYIIITIYQYEKST